MGRRRSNGGLPRPRKSVDGDVDTAKRPYTLPHIVSMRCDGFSYSEIGKYYGVTKQAIGQQLQGVWGKLDKEKIQAFREKKLEVYDATLLEILTYMVKPEVLKKASGNNLAYMGGQVHQMRRLEAGESTTNIALHTIVEAMERRRKGLKPAPEPGSDGASEHE